MFRRPSGLQKICVQSLFLRQLRSINGRTDSRFGQDSNCIYSSFKVLSHIMRLCESIETVSGILPVLLIVEMKFDDLKLLRSNFKS